ncbi:MAG: hypothetical protein AWL62_2877, partial [Halanaerobium sp. T82-1]
EGKELYEDYLPCTGGIIEGGDWIEN